MDRACDKGYRTSDRRQAFQAVPLEKFVVARNKTRENEHLAAIVERPYIAVVPIDFKGPRGVLKAEGLSKILLTSARIGTARYGKDVPGTATVEICDGASRTFSFHVEEIDSDAMLIQQENQ